ncbi:unnamed protein product [Spodoptera exigua]|nr:unnamed protein product [Spodoptera exigua]
MFKHLVNSRTMQRNAAFLTILCIFLCLTFNYTFPLHREGSSNVFRDVYGNHSKICTRSDHHDNMLDRTKKMGNKLDNVFKRFKDSTQDLSRNIQARLTNVKNSLSEEDLRQYEQLVIMKKYPYLDLKEIEFKFNSPPEKTARQSVKYDAGRNNVGDPSFCEPLDESPSVEIINRGLTGFAIPAKIVKNTKLLEAKLKFNNMKAFEDSTNKQNAKLAFSANSATHSNTQDRLRGDSGFYET